jgi:hypothetical protein
MKTDTPQQIAIPISGELATLALQAHSMIKTMKPAELLKFNELVCGSIEKPLRFTRNAAGLKTLCALIGFVFSEHLKDAQERTIEKSKRKTACHPDWITCCVCQVDLSEPIGEHEKRDDWPAWLNAGCCSPECFKQCSGKKQ